MIKARSVHKNPSPALYFITAGISVIIFYCSGCFSGTSCEISRMPDLGGAVPIGSDKCRICHRSAQKQTMHSFHIKFSDGTDSGGVCESCHGPGSLHSVDPDNNTIIHFPDISSRDRSEICLRCHNNTVDIARFFGSHGSNNIDCTVCHTEHSDTSGKMLKAREPALCFSCHPDIEARCRLPSHHPVREKKMRCSSCHPPHRELFSVSKRITGNDLCLDCHSEYQGPFIYEHAPAAEDCCICHNPHGSISNNLLRQSEPFLCLRCHRGHKNDPSEAHPTAATFYTSCTQCHSMIHGSDLPSSIHRGGLIR